MSEKTQQEGAAHTVPCGAAHHAYTSGEDEQTNPQACMNPWFSLPKTPQAHSDFCHTVLTLRYSTVRSDEHEHHITKQSQKRNQWCQRKNYSFIEKGETMLSLVMIVLTLLIVPAVFSIFFLTYLFAASLSGIVSQERRGEINIFKHGQWKVALLLFLIAWAILIGFTWLTSTIYTIQ
jgi:hypothetical protein